MDIRIVKNTETDRLFDLIRETFITAFGPANTQENMDQYRASHLQDDHLLRQFSNPESWFYFLVDQDDNPMGYLKLNKGKAQNEDLFPNGLEIERIYVSQEHQNKGLGQKLIDFCITKAEADGFDPLWLGVWDQNFGAIKFYKRNGFVPFGKHSFWLGSDHQTDILMKLEPS